MVLLNLLHRHDYSCTFLDVRILHLGCHTYVISVLYSCRNIFNQSYLVIIFQKLLVTLYLYLYLYRICTCFHVFASQLMHVPFIFYIIYIYTLIFSQKSKHYERNFLLCPLKRKILPACRSAGPCFLCVCFSIPQSTVDPKHMSPFAWIGLWDPNHDHIERGQSNQPGCVSNQ